MLSDRLQGDTSEKGWKQGLEGVMESPEENRDHQRLDYASNIWSDGQLCESLAVDCFLLEKNRGKVR